MEPNQPLSIRTQDQSKLEAIQKLFELKKSAGAESFYFFCKNILGYDKLEIQPHKEICDKLQVRKKRFKLFLIPRGCFKTTICTIGYPIWSLLHRNPNLRVMLTSDKFENSTKYLFEAKQLLQSENIKMLYGDLVGGRWREEEVDLSIRTVKRKEPNLFCASQDVTRVGYHADIIVCDDLVTDINTQNREQMRSNVEYFRSLFSILEPDGEMIVVGTRWRYDPMEMYQYILENLSGDFDITVRRLVDNNNRILFPQRFNPESIEQLKTLHGSFMFSAQYQNDPFDPEKGIFKTIKMYTMLPMDKKDLEVTITVDPSMGETKESDPTAFIICGTDINNQTYILDTINVRINPTALIDYVFALDDMWKPKAIGIEMVSFQKSLKYFIEQEMAKRKRYLPIVEIRPDMRRSKMNRIIGLEPYITRGQILVREDQKELIDQMKAYPRSQHDDLVDALAMQLELIQERKKEDGEETKFVSADEEIGELARAGKVARKRNQEDPEEELSDDIGYGL